MFTEKIKDNLITLALLYESERSEVKTLHIQRMNVAEVSMLRRMCNKIIYDKISKERILKKL